MDGKTVFEKILNPSFDPFGEIDFVETYLAKIDTVEKLEEFLNEAEKYLKHLSEKYKNPPYPYRDEEIEDDAADAGVIAVALGHAAGLLYPEYNPLSLKREEIPQRLLKRAEYLHEVLWELSDRLEEYLNPHPKVIPISEKEALQRLKKLEEELERLKNVNLTPEVLDEKLLTLREELEDLHPAGVNFLEKTLLEATEEDLRLEEVKRANYSDLYWRTEQKIKAFHKEVLKRWIESTENDGKLWSELKLGEFEEDTPSLLEKVAAERIKNRDRERVVKDLKEILEIFERERRVFEEEHTELFRLAVATISSFADLYLSRLREAGQRLAGFDELIEEIEEKHLKFLKEIAQTYTGEELERRANNLAREIILIAYGLDPKFNPGLPPERLWALLDSLSEEELDELRRHRGLPEGGFDGV